MKIYPHICAIRGDRSAEARKQPNGIKYVFANGVTIVKKAKQTGVTPGRGLRRE